MSRTQITRTAIPWYQQRAIFKSANFGLNLPWLNLHNGSEAVNWLNTSYDSTKIEADLVMIASLGITKIRTWAQLESMYNYTGGVFVENATYTANLDDFLTRCNNHGISVILVIADGKEDSAPSDLDGKFRWDLVQSGGGITVYNNAYTAYVNRFKSHTNILMWEISNEPYANLTWALYPQSLSVTKDQVHSYLQGAYTTIKATVPSALVGFSDYEEEEQTRYQTFSDATNRASYVDDCTDVYSLHIYRPDASYIADFRTLTSKPKWCTELGNLNYYDPTASAHPIAGYNELLNTELNYSAVCLGLWLTITACFYITLMDLTRF